MLLTILAALVARLPWRALRSLGAALGFVAGTLLRIRRRHVVESLRRAGLEPAEEHAEAMYGSLGTGIFEFLWLAGRNRAELSAHFEVDPDQWRALEQALSEQRGLVVATAHTGNWDLLGCAVARHFALTVVTKRLSVRWLDRFWQKARAEQGVLLVPAQGALQQASQALKRAGLVALLIDQAPHREKGVLLWPFLGREAQHDLSFAALAARHRAPVAIAFDERLADGRHRLHIPKILYPPERPSQQWIQAACKEACRQLEQFICAHPGQWLWLHRRWRLTASRSGAGLSSQAPSALSQATHKAEPSKALGASLGA